MRSSLASCLHHGCPVCQQLLRHPLLYFEIFIINLVVQVVIIQVVQVVSPLDEEIQGVDTVCVEGASDHGGGVGVRV